MKKVVFGIMFTMIGLIGVIFLISWAAFYETLVFSVWWGFPIIVTVGCILFILGVLGIVLLYDEIS